MKGFFNGLLGQSDKKSSADVAKDRLRVIVETNTKLGVRLSAEQIDKMKHEVLAVVNKFISGVRMTDVHIQQRQEANADILEMNVNLPDPDDIKNHP